MKLCYQVATPDVAQDESVTAYQGNLETSFANLAAYGYDGVELMSRDPEGLDWAAVRQMAAQHGLSIVMICTGEVYGQSGISFTDPEEKRRTEAVRRVCKLVDCASACGAGIVNIGRVRGSYSPKIPHAQTDAWAIEAFRTISDYAAKQDVRLALENVTIMQTNFINTIQEAAEMVDRVGRENFKVMMDVFHLNIEEKDMVETIKRYAAYNIHVHLSDNNRRYPGQCGLDFPKIIRTFHDVGFDGAFCTEVFQYPNQDVAARETIAYLGPIFREIYGRPFPG